MKISTYQVKKENVFIGQIVRPRSVKNKLLLENGTLSVYNFIPYRSILFTINEQGWSDDLLYDSKEYPILNQSQEQECLDAEVLIRDAYNLEPLITFSKMPDVLTLKDIIAIRKQFFSGSWGYDHAHLFGFREVEPSDWTYVENGSYVQDPEALKRLQRRERFLQRCGHRVFEQMDEGAILKADMMYIFDEFGDHSIMEVLQGFEKSKNAFKPHPEEGKVKKLTI